MGTTAQIAGGLAMAALVCACGGPTRYRPGTLPPALAFQILHKKPLAELERAHDPGQPPPDAVDGRVAIWRPRTLFGDHAAHPGASIRLMFSSTSYYAGADPTIGREHHAFCLLVRDDGRVGVSWVNPDDPTSIGSWEDPGESSLVLVLDETENAAHTKLGVIRLDIVKDGVKHTLTEDAFARKGWLVDRNKPKRWSLRKLARSYRFDVHTVRGRRGGKTLIGADLWNDHTLTPTLRLDGKGHLRFELFGPEHRSGRVEDVIRIEGASSARTR